MHLSGLHRFEILQLPMADMQAVMQADLISIAYCMSLITYSLIYMLSDATQCLLSVAVVQDGDRIALDS